MRFGSTIDKILTSGIGSLDADTFRRIRFLNGFALILVVAAPLMGLFYFYTGAPFLFHTFMLAGVLGMALLLLARAFKNPTVVGNLAVFVLWGLLTVVRWNTGPSAEGGLIFLSWVWNAVLILMAIFVTGYFWGTLWACLIFVESGLVVYLLRGGHSFSNLIPSDISSAYALGSYLTGLLAVLLLAFVYEKERNEANLRDEEKTLNMQDLRKYSDELLERSPVPTFVVDKSHRVVQWNRACQEITGISAQEIVGKQVCHGLFMDEEGSLADKFLENPEGVADRYKEVMVSHSESGSFSLETILPNLRGGTPVIVSTAPILDQDGTLRGAIQTVQDVSSRGFDTPAAGFSNRGADSGYHPVYRVDSKGRVSGWNKACERDFGYSSTQMLGQSPLQLISKPYRAHFRETIVKTLQGEPFQGLEWKYYTMEGEPLYILADIYPVHSDSGEISECIVFNTNVTHIRLRVKKLERYALDCKEKLNTLTREYDLLQKNIASFIRKKE